MLSRMAATFRGFAFLNQPGLPGRGAALRSLARTVRASTLVVTPPGLALAVVDGWMWARNRTGEAAAKESGCRAEGHEFVADLAEQTPATRLVYATDREGD